VFTPIALPYCKRRPGGRSGSGLSTGFDNARRDLGRRVWLRVSANRTRLCLCEAGAEIPSKNEITSSGSMTSEGSGGRGSAGGGEPGGECQLCRGGAGKTLSESMDSRDASGTVLAVGGTLAAADPRTASNSTSMLVVRAIERGRLMALGGANEREGGGVGGAGAKIELVRASERDVSRSVDV